MAALSENQVDMLERLRNHSIWDQLRVLVMDTGGCFIERHSRVVELVTSQPSTISMVVMYDTKLDIKTSRRDTMWPNYRMIRNDELGDGVLLQFHNKLKVEEMTGMPRDVAGMWVVVCGGVVEDKQNVSVIGVINAIKETEDELLN